MSDFKPVARVSELTDPGKLTVECDERLVVVFCVDGNYYCLDDVCTHDGGPLGEGQLSGCQIACPRHGAKFDIRDGQALTMPATQATHSHEVRIDGEDVLVKLSS
ncbi:MAG: non-heme iron oxygenase ferredoxin subunit [Planctomycetales bacterium]